MGAPGVAGQDLAARAHPWGQSLPQPPGISLGMGKGWGWAGTSSCRPDEENQGTGPTADPGPAARWWPSQGPGGAPAESNSQEVGTRSGSGLPATSPGASPQGHSEMGTSSVPDLSWPSPAAKPQDENCLTDPDSLVHSASTLHLSKVSNHLQTVYFWGCSMFCTIFTVICSVYHSWFCLLGRGNTVVSLQTGSEVSKSTDTGLEVIK